MVNLLSMHCTASCSISSATVKLFNCLLIASYCTDNEGDTDKAACLFMQLGKIGTFKTVKLLLNLN